MERLQRWVGLGTLWLVLAAGHARAADHPLEPLSASEQRIAFELVSAHFRADASLPKTPLRFPLVVLSDPPKAFVLGYRAGQALPRVAEVQVMHAPTNRLWVARVDLARKRVLSLELQPAGSQGAIVGDEYEAAASLVRAYPPWQAAMRARGLDPELVFVDVWAPGDEPLPAAVAASLPHAQATRIVRCLSFDRGATLASFDPRVPHNPYARPVEGVVVTVDMNAGQVVHMTDTVKAPVIAESGNARSSQALAPLVVTQPSGSGLQVRGRLVRWQRWQFYAVMHPREGLVLYDVRFEDQGKWRPIAYRLSVSEIYVPYGLGDHNWIWRSAFDVGEYNAGMLAQRLEVDRDVPENVVLLDSLFFSPLGPNAQQPDGSELLPATLGLYERDAGVLWTRTDPSTAARDTRLGRELVATWNCWVGNYIYGFDWIFKLDGSIEVSVHLNGTTLNRGSNGVPEVSAPKVGKDARGVTVAAPHHQHFLGFRLDLDVDGPLNHVMEMEIAPQPNTGFKNSFAAVTRRLTHEGYRDADPFAARHWHVMSARTLNPLGNPTSYAVEGGSLAVPYSTPDFPPLERAAFARHQLWASRYAENERYVGGTFPNRSPRPDGVTQFVSPAEPLDGVDVVLWYTIGFTHVARTEDYPVMPSDTIGFKLVPRGFFAQNPALDVADQAGSK